MRRDMDLVRTVLLSVEESDAQVLAASELASNLWDEITVARHIELMIEAGLVVGEVSRNLAGGMHAFVMRITWAGYDFLDAVRSETVWEDTKASIGDRLGTASFEVVKTVAAAVAMKALGL